MTVLHVLFKVAGADYAIPAADVLQMESYIGATRVPGTAKFVAGILQVRGRVVPVIDLRARFGLPPVEATIDSRVVIGFIGERAVGMLVDSAREVAKLAPEAFKPPPETVMAAGEGFVRAVADLNGRLVMLIDFVRVIGEGSHVQE